MRDISDRPNVQGREPGFSGDTPCLKDRAQRTKPLCSHTRLLVFPVSARVSFVGFTLVFHGVWFPEGGHYTAAPRTLWRTLADRVAPRLFNRHFAGTSTANCEDIVTDCLAVVNSFVP